MRTFVYPVNLRRDHQTGGFVVRFNDFPEAITQGNTLEEAISEAADCLEEAVAGRIRRGEPIPAPSRPRARQQLIPVPTPMALKAALYLALMQAGTSKVELAKRLRCDEKEIRRMLDPRHPTKLPRIQAALAVLGKRLALSLEEAA